VILRVDYMFSLLQNSESVSDPKAGTFMPTRPLITGLKLLHEPELALAAVAATRFHDRHLQISDPRNWKSGSAGSVIGVCHELRL
jgi:hypothetical protein